MQKLVLNPRVGKVYIGVIPYLTIWHRTARHVETGVASFGEDEADALRQLADALDSHFGHGKPIDDPEAYLEEQGIDVEVGSEGPPPWLE